jgi:serine/threonine protein kinase
MDIKNRALLTKLLSVDPTKRPSASDAILHPYLTASFSDRLVASGELLHQDEKLEAVRSLIKKVRYDHKNAKESITVHRYTMKEDEGEEAAHTDKNTDDDDDDNKNTVTLSPTSLEKKQHQDKTSNDYKRIVDDVLAHFDSRGQARNRLKVTFHGEVYLSIYICLICIYIYCVFLKSNTAE